ncbi:MAG: hypothetical protein PSU94_00595 [Lacunisphaera sp.]|nr:hypothetical protein [Lacunisphaera sp.]
MKASASRRGSVLITCLIFAIIIAIALTSYLKLAGNSYMLADRAFLNTTAVALAEQGLEQGLECYNQLDDAATPAQAWTGWTLSGTVATFKNASFPLDNGAVGTIQIYATDYNPAPGTSPKLVAKTTVLPANGLGLSRMIEITLKRRTIFAGGLVARETIQFSTSTLVTSWNSDPDNNAATAAVGYSSAASTAHAFVGTISTANDAINTSGGDIYGRIGTGGGTVAHTGGALLTDSPTGSGWDASLVDSNFASNLVTPVAPALPAGVNTVTTSISADTTLPRAGDTAAADGKYYYNFASGAAILLGGNDRLTVSDKVVVYLQNHAGATAVSLGGTAKIQITSAGNLTVYTNGNMAVGGNGMANANANASSCLIYGTNTGSGQTIAMTGNATTVTAINAPNADFSITGSGEVWGAVIARNIALNGNAAFRYDEALPNFINTTGTGNPWGVAKWREMTQSTEREIYAGNFNF